MKIAVIGSGYVGLPVSACLADGGHTVYCVDKDKSKIKSLKEGKSVLFEKELDALLVKHRKTGRFIPTTSMVKAIKDAALILICVGTPENPVTHEADLSFVMAVGDELAPLLTNGQVVAVKSTVPIGTGDVLEQRMRAINKTVDFDLISLPEFLREGVAVYDFLHPDRIIVGTDSERARDLIKKVYRPFNVENKLMFFLRRSAETVKYASNAFLAIKLHYINEMADLCQKTGADIGEVAAGIGADSRIGSAFLRPGPGYGGSCLPKDTNAIASFAEKEGVSMSLIKAVIASNDNRMKMLANDILKRVKTVKKPKIGVLGLAFKQNTDDCRNSPAISVVSWLLKGGACVTAFDPQAEKTAEIPLGDDITYAATPYEALADADLAVVLTEWDMFATLDWKKVAEVMNTPYIVDTRYIVPVREAKKAGVRVFQKGRIQ